MAIRGFKPTTPARRKMTVATFEEITKTTPPHFTSQGQQETENF